VQTYVDDFIINYGVTPSAQKHLSFSFTPMTTQPWRSDPLLSFSVLLFFLIGIANCPSVVTMVSSLVKDKEFKQREGMAMMGMSTLTYYSSFFFYRLLIAIFQALVMAWQMNAAVFQNSNYFAVFLM
jgi:ATP-binding cassette subfamily A (ABC1) protein 3